MNCFLRFSLLLLLTILDNFQATTTNSLPPACVRSINGDYNRNSKRSWASFLTEENPDNQICLLNVPASDYCQFWRVTAIVLLKQSTQADQKTNDIVDFLKTVIEFCDQQSELVMFTPIDQNELCLEYSIGSDTQKDYLSRLSSSDTTVPSDQLAGVILDNILNQLKICTDKEPFQDQEAGALFIFTDFSCEELCEQSNLGAMVGPTFFRRRRLVDCLTVLFNDCALQQTQLCNMRYLDDSSLLGARANTSHTCPSQKGISTIGLILAIAIPCIVVITLILILAFICIRHRLKKKWFHFWFEHTRQKAYSEDEQNYSNCNEYMDIKRLRENRIEDLWEIDPNNLEIYIGHLLGSGAFASVYKGKLSGTIPLLNIHSSLNVQIEGRQGSVYDVAVKKLPNHADESARVDFQHEVDFMKCLGYHLHIISLIGCVTSKIQPMIIVEYAHNGDLLKFLRTHKKNFNSNKRASCRVNTDMSLTLKDLISYSWQISDGMVFLSSNKYIHRDLAARNILLTKNLIGDFGLCRELNTMLYTAKGGRLPIKWMAPESLKYYEYSSKSDVWSFGVLLFELFSLGEAPYPTVQPTEMPEYLEQGNRLPKPQHCPEQMYQLMTKCWEKNPDFRPSFIQIREEIRQLLNSHDEQYGYLPIDLGGMDALEEVCPIDLENFEEEALQSVISFETGNNVEKDEEKEEEEDDADDAEKEEEEEEIQNSRL